MKVEVHLYSQSKPILYENVKNTYTKDGLFCIYTDNNTVTKYPLQHVFRIIEDY